MSLVFDSNNNIFLKQEYKKHSGSPANYTDGPAEAFYINHFVSSKQFDASFLEYDTPSYYTLGGTLNYYSQDYWSIFTNISRPFIKFTFTANTNNFGTGTTIKHEIYRINHKDYIEYTNEIIRNNTKKTSSYIFEETENTITNNSGISTTTLTRKKTASNNTSEELTPKSFPKEVPGFFYGMESNYDKPKSLLTNPILTITATTTGISASDYYLFLEKYQKSLGNYEYQLFEDYGQYFITTQFEFERPQGAGLYDFYAKDDEKKLIPIEYKCSYKELTPTNIHTITGGTFSGVTVFGNYFTYFLIPNKPKWETPYVQNVLDTFSPTFFWSNTDDGNSFLLQVVYNSGDSQSFSGVVYSYPIEKEKTALSTDEMLNRADGDWSITQKTLDVVRKYSVPLFRGKQFWYRIGNVKELKNIFGVNQNVVTFSDILSATTSPLPYTNTVYVKSDSSHVEAISEWVFPEYLKDDISGTTQYSLSGKVVGSIVTGTTMQLIYPNSNYETQLTDSVGNYLFVRLEPGIYTLNAFYRGYQQYSQTVNMIDNTVLPTIKLKLMWDNNYDTWGKMANENYYI